MAKRSRFAKDGPRLFQQQEQALERRIRRQRALFIPKYVKEASENQQLAGPQQDRAFGIAVHWADQETSGHLIKHKETSIDTQFLDQLFGEGLGYANKTVDPENYQLEHKFSVPEVGLADGAIGDFPKARVPTVVIELKDALTDLDRDRSNNRTAVRQCWDYMDALPECQWGIVSNFSTIRLYHKTKGSLAYEEFTLQELRDRDRFNQFYAIFERGGLLRSRAGQIPRALALLEKTEKRQKEVGDDLYNSYQLQRLRLIEHLKLEQGKTLDEAIRIAQKLLDRIIFIAFCEDRDLLPEDSLNKAYSELPPFSRVTNPRWRNFLDLFAAVDQGANGRRQIPKFNGGLFAHDPAVDTLDLDDEPWANALMGFGKYDFSEEVNVEVLGHLFERSITELEKLRVGGLFALKANIDGANGNGATRTTKGKRKAKAARKADDDEDSAPSKMPKSAQRKRFGIYYTPPGLHRPHRRAYRRRLGKGALCRARQAAQGRSRGPQRPEPREAPRLLDRLSRIVEGPHRLRPRLRLRCIPHPRLRIARRLLQDRCTRSGWRGIAQERGRYPRRIHPRPHPQPQSLRRRPVAGSRRDHAVGPVDSLRPPRQNPRRPLPAHHPRQ